MTKYQRLGGLNKGNLPLMVLEAGSLLKVLAGLVSPEASLCGLTLATFILGPSMIFLLCECIPGVSYRTPIVLD